MVMSFVPMCCFTGRFNLRDDECVNKNFVKLGVFIWGMCLTTFLSNMQFSWAFMCKIRRGWIFPRLAVCKATLVECDLTSRTSTP